MSVLTAMYTDVCSAWCSIYCQITQPHPNIRIRNILLGCLYVLFLNNENTRKERIIDYHALAMSNFCVFALLSQGRINMETNGQICATSPPTNPLFFSKRSVLKIDNSLAQRR